MNGAGPIKITVPMKIDGDEIVTLLKSHDLLANAEISLCIQITLDGTIFQCKTAKEAITALKTFSKDKKVNE